MIAEVIVLDTVHCTHAHHIPPFLECRKKKEMFTSSRMTLLTLLFSLTDHCIYRM